MTKDLSEQLTALERVGRIATATLAAAQSAAEALAAADLILATRKATGGPATGGGAGDEARRFLFPARAACRMRSFASTSSLIRNSGARVPDRPARNACELAELVAGVPGFLFRQICRNKDERFPLLALLCFRVQLLSQLGRANDGLGALPDGQIPSVLLRQDVAVSSRSPFPRRSCP